jgi:hypothetical protein
MNRFLAVLIFFLLAGVSSELLAQQGMTPGSSSSSKAAFGTESFSSFIDGESKTLFIDFESVRANIKEIVLKNAFGEILFMEHVSDLPVNVIYELDMNRYKAGQYRIELHTFSGVLSKDVQVN